MILTWSQDVEQPPVYHLCAVQTSKMDHRAWQTTLINLDIINLITLFCFLLFGNSMTLYNPDSLKVKILLLGGSEMAQLVKMLATKPDDLSSNPRTRGQKNRTNTASGTLTSCPHSQGNKCYHFYLKILLSSPCLVIRWFLFSFLSLDF